MNAVPFSYKPNLLCIVPPYTITCPPAGAAALLGYLKANGCNDFSFLDLRLHVPYSYAPTYRPSGVFGESFVLDVPDLPIVLRMLQAYEAGRDLSEGLGEEWFVDYCVMRGIHPHTLAAYLRGVDRFLERTFSQIRDLRFVGFSTWTSNFFTTLMAAAHLKRRKNPPFIVAGGPQVTESPNSAKLALRSGLFDVVALGEGEETLLSLYEAFSKDGKTVTGQTPGTMRVDPASGAFVTSERPLLRLKDLPLPSFDEMSIQAYRSASGAREIPYQLSRGCTDKCSFCSEWVFWRKYRLGSAESSVEHIQELQSRYGAQVIHFTDSLVNGSMARLREFAETMLKRNVIIPWFGFMRAEMDPETAKLLRRSGCVHAFIGIESLSTETLELMNKRRTEADNMRALRTFLEAGIRVVAGFIPGFPGDTRERFMHTARALVGLQTRFPGLLEANTEPFILSPGQPIYRDLAKFGLQTRPWKEEILGGAGAYEDIARDVACTFEGPNQGVDRLGELRVAETLLGGGSVYKRLEEVHSPFEFDFTHVDMDAFVARTQAAAGHSYALLVTRAEKETLERMRTAESLMQKGEPTPVTEREHLQRWLVKMEAEHVVFRRRDHAIVMENAFSIAPPDGALLRASPFLVARALGGALVALHSITLELMKLPLASAALLSSLTTVPRTKREVAEALGREVSAARLDELVRKGLLEVCGPALATPVFTPRAPVRPPLVPDLDKAVHRLPMA